MNTRQILAYLIFGLIGALIGFVVGEMFGAQMSLAGVMDDFGNLDLKRELFLRIGSTLAVIGFVAGVGLAWARRQLLR